MARLSPEHNEYAVTTLEKIIRIREISQKQLEKQSGISQSEISRIQGKKKIPTKRELEQLFEALGIRLSDIISLVDNLPENLIAYVATPLTGITTDIKKDSALRSFVKRIETIATGGNFKQPGFRFYWPGHYTHPVDHAHVPPRQVYITDRSRASSYNLVIMLCAEPSYGVGQENEIATQAGVPAIRLVPTNLSRMMTGSFVKSSDIPYTGSLESLIRFNEQSFLTALVEIRKAYFMQQALYSGLATFDFGGRLEALVDDRIGSAEFANRIGVNDNYANALFVEPLVVSNPGSILLLKIAKVLGVTVAYLLGETTVDDATFTASMSSWNKWVSETAGLDAQSALHIRDTWAKEYELNREPSIQSHRNRQTLMKKADWNGLYIKESDKKVNANKTPSLF